jgi:hypothetical protein
MGSIAPPGGGVKAVPPDELDTRSAPRPVARSHRMVSATRRRIEAEIRSGLEPLDPRVQAFASLLKAFDGENRRAAARATRELWDLGVTVVLVGPQGDRRYGARAHGGSGVRA